MELWALSGGRLVMELWALSGALLLTKEDPADE